MHLLAAQPGTISDGTEAVDLCQSPADLVVLSAADTELAALAAAYGTWGDAPVGLRLANLTRLAHHMSVDLYVEQVIAHARLVVVRLLGGRSYWPYGIEQIVDACRRFGIALALLPGADQPDPDLMADSTVEPQSVERLWAYLLHGGPENCRSFLAHAANLLGHGTEWLEPRPLPQAGLYGEADAGDGRPQALVVFYRALVLAGDTAPVDALIAGLRGQGLAASALFVHSLKDPVSAALTRTLLTETPPDVIVNATGFAVSSPGKAETGPFDAADCPVLQVILASGTEEAWKAGTQGLGPRDIAMNVALPEVDGRIITRAISFKQARRDAATQCDLAIHAPVADRIQFVTRLAANWAKLRRKAPEQRRIALVLANYPNRDGRIGNGVGLDTPAATIQVLRALDAAGYGVGDIPESGNALIELIQAGATNDWRALAHRERRETLALPDYLAWFQSQPRALQDKVTARWGAPEADPFFAKGELTCGDFILPATRFGFVTVAVQPARGYNIDPASSYHDPDLVPPHNYLAFYAWMQDGFRADAVVHMGKHGNLEWLPGKALALSAECFSEAALGPLPHLYPFIVNDPGEGTQAKRRASAVIIDHLTPPLTRAESYGPLRELERLVDEYYEAAGVDPRRLGLLRREILTLSAAAGLDEDLGISRDDAPDEALKKLDNHLCELKELQIRDGLHIFGLSPMGDQLTDLLVALARVPRGSAPEGASLPRALAGDLGLDFDPLDCVPGDDWTGPRPQALGGDAPWRSHGDAVERLEVLSRALIAGERQPEPGWAKTIPVLQWIETHLRPTVEACGGAEIQGLLKGLAGHFVAPGPSGAPTRGRPDVLPTGRNFYSVDTRAVPTPAAWSLGWKSAQLLLERHLQEHGDWPKALALTAWGTSNMRTGGDDIAQGLALMGVKPRWDVGSNRVSGFEILPATVLDRPRIDVTLRVSGFFRDAFPGLIDLFDSASRAVAALDEPAEINPLAERVRAERTRLEGEGASPEQAARQAGFRVFGSMPGAYGAGLQALIDEKGWATRADLAESYMAWGGWAYGAGAEGEAGHGLFRQRLSKVEAVVQNQDNREHDLLDSDDYYQFEGGLAAAVETASGRAPTVWHADHSRPETPRIRTLDDEIARIVRARVVNPKWIKGVMRHGYKGAFEMAASVDYLFAFAATTKAVKDHHFDLVAEAYLGDEEVLDFLEANNPAALADIRTRLNEAIERGLWQPRRNSTHRLLEADPK
ncbi:CobN component of cobalt chelatase involved in B12 biosynthesis [Paramagnetospirillum magnetotacticum MS-1]|uniref:Cobaltochelatase subunit CobN n=1 Tax=Paramagnetospirillum magnetotacticum MS-1 TaxID=272627 RepID=A0A0C2YS63_PARME|nr:cobaltochelatase subunit CobN [Paramagnetospirillum magnetotacticum]KIL97973.1 CobN component of cobalt chelatase involved in B12 biosynthesis [Paramagnetospirillum magnetotacticum MS-1]